MKWFELSVPDPALLPQISGILLMVGRSTKRVTIPLIEAGPAKHNARRPAPATVAFWGVADISRQTKFVGSVENDPKLTWTSRRLKLARDKVAKALQIIDCFLASYFPAQNTPFSN